MIKYTIYNTDSGHPLVTLAAKQQQQHNNTTYEDPQLPRHSLLSFPRTRTAADERLATAAAATHNNLFTATHLNWHELCTSQGGLIQSTRSSFSRNVFLSLVGGQAAVGVELPAGEQQRDHVDQGSDPAVGGRLKRVHERASIGAQVILGRVLSYLHESLVRGRKELVRVRVMLLNGQVLHQGHAVDVEEHSHQGLEAT